MTDFANAIPTAVDIVRREKCYEGFYKLERVHLRHELFAGGMSCLLYTSDAADE